MKKKIWRFKLLKKAQVFRFPPASQIIAAQPRLGGGFNLFVCFDVGSEKDSTKFVERYFSVIRTGEEFEGGNATHIASFLTVHVFELQPHESVLKLVESLSKVESPKPELDEDDVDEDEDEEESAPENAKPTNSKGTNPW